MELAGRVAIVTGGAHRVGRALLLGLARAGCDVLLHYNRSEADAQRTADEARAFGVRVAVHQAELARHETLTPLIEAAQAQLGPVSILVNSAATFPKDTLLDLTTADWTATLQTNLRAPVLLTQAFARALPADEIGAVINITDWRSQRPYRDHFSYTIAKGALDTFTQAAALQLAPRIRVNGIALGAMLPPPDGDQGYLDRLAEKLPLQRAGGVEVIVDTMLFLLNNDFITGEIVRLDGGAHLK